MFESQDVVKGKSDSKGGLCSYFLFLNLDKTHILSSPSSRVFVVLVFVDAMGHLFV
jgi:hypothetical protein